jgi:hypothetical protein
VAGRLSVIVGVTEQVETEEWGSLSGWEAELHLSQAAPEGFLEQDPWLDAFHVTGKELYPAFDAQLSDWLSQKCAMCVDDSCKNGFLNRVGNIQKLVKYFTLRHFPV